MTVTRIVRKIIAVANPFGSIIYGHMQQMINPTSVVVTETKIFRGGNAVKTVYNEEKKLCSNI